MNYEEMSDFEINKAVSSKFRKVWTWKCEVFLSMSSTKPFDPCNNPSDAWPIIVDNKITVDSKGAAWVHDVSVDDIHYEDGIGCDAYCDGKPLRAAMICFLKVRDAEK